MLGYLFSLYAKLPVYSLYAKLPVYSLYARLPVYSLYAKLPVFMLSYQNKRVLTFTEIQEKFLDAFIQLG